MRNIKGMFWLGCVGGNINETNYAKHQGDVLAIVMGERGFLPF